MKRQLICAFGALAILVFASCSNPIGSSGNSVPTPTAKSSNAELSGLAISTGVLSPAFVASTTAYSVSVDNSITSIVLTATKANADATVSANNGVIQSLSVGANPITITVTAQDGTTVKNYVVTVTRAAPSSTNADLSTLSVSSGNISPAFASATTAYSVSVGNAVTSIVVTGTKSDANATISTNNGVVQSLSVGANPIIITVTAQDGTTVKNYVVTVTRAAPSSSNANLSNLTVSSGSISPYFTSANTAYSVSVGNAVTTIVVTGTKSDANATVSGNNGVAQSLSVGANPITITVTAQDGTTVKNYVVTVNRAAPPSSNADLSNLSVSFGSLSPAFGSSITAYSVSVPNSMTSITVSGTRSDINATLSANNGVAQNLNVGANIITIGVTAQNGTTFKYYEVTVYRAPAAPSNITVRAGITITQISWATVPGATSYNLYRSTTPGVTTSNSSKTSYVTSPYLITGLNDGTTYYYVLTAVNGAESATSDEVSKTSGFEKGGIGPTGGFLFYDAGSVQSWGRYLECAPSDQSTNTVWWNGTVSIPGAQNTAVGTGRANTAAIIASTGGGNYLAAGLCKNLILGGKADWFLPSKDELALMYTNLQLNGLGNFDANDYWSSSQFSSTDAWYHRFTTGNQAYYTTFNKTNVRAVRAF